MDEQKRDVTNGNLDLVLPEVEDGTYAGWLCDMP
jgi:hypothetical protein